MPIAIRWLLLLDYLFNAQRINGISIFNSLYDPKYDTVFCNKYDEETRPGVDKVKPGMLAFW